MRIYIYIYIYTYIYIYCHMQTDCFIVSQLRNYNAYVLSFVCLHIAQSYTSAQLVRTGLGGNC